MASKSFKLFNASLSVMRHSHSILASLRDQRLAMEEFSTLRSLRATVNEHGITKGLLAFANRNNLLSQVVSALPATESLNNVPLTVHDRRHIAALEGIDETLSQEGNVASSWTRELSGDLEKMLNSVLPVVDELCEAVHTANADLAMRSLPEGAIDTTTVNTRTADGFDTIFCAVAKRLNQIGCVNVESFFSSSEYRDANRNFIAELVEEFKPLIGYTLSEGHFVHAGSDEIDEAFKPREGTLAELGFTDEGIKTVLEHASDLLEAIRTLCDKKMEIASALADVADRLAAPSEQTFDVGDSHFLISNYATVILMLVEDGLHHIHEAMAVVEEIFDVHSIRSGDGRSD